MRAKKIIFILVICLATVLLPNIAKAASTVTLTDITVTTAAGTYKEGDEITIEANFSGELASDSVVPTLCIRFGNSSFYGINYINEGVISNNKITYKYVVKENESGELTLESYTGGVLKDKDGNLIIITAPSSLSGNKIEVNPMIWTDTSNVECSIPGEGDNENRLIISGITKNNKNSYYCFITNSSDEPTIETDEDGYIKGYDSNLFDFDVSNWLERAGDLHLWLYEEQINYSTGNREHKAIVAGDKLERPAQNKIGARIASYFFNDRTSTILWEPHDDGNTRNINLKIGKITDKSILLAIKNEETGCLAKLLDYAKSAEPVYEGVVPLAYESATITDKFDIIDGEYYYVYMELEAENGKYYPVEDVSLYQGLVGDTIGKNLYNYLDDQFVWNLEDDPIDVNGKDDTTVPDGKLPQTGENVIILSVVGALIAVMVGAYIGIKKYRNI